MTWCYHVTQLTCYWPRDLCYQDSLPPLLVTRIGSHGNRTSWLPITSNHITWPIPRDLCTLGTDSSGYITSNHQLLRLGTGDQEAPPQTSPTSIASFVSDRTTNKYSPEFDISIQFVLLPSFSHFIHPAPTYSEKSPTTVMNLSSTTNTFASTFRSLLILSLSLHLPEPHSSALVSSVLSAYTVENRICSKFFRIRYGKSRICPL